MEDVKLHLDQVLFGDCNLILPSLPEKSFNLIFADPPYNLQLARELWRPNSTKVKAVDASWDQFSDFEAYDRFTRSWLSQCRRVLKDNGTIWVIGTYHNIFRVGRILQDLDFWILNDVIWIKNNPMPNFRGVRFTNAHETLIWAQKVKGEKYTFNYRAMKSMNIDAAQNSGLQMRSDWKLPICTGKERLKNNGGKAHPTQKPEALLQRVILSSSKPGDVILDPFFGSGTTGAVAKKLGRHWIGIEAEESYISIASQRIAAIMPNMILNQIDDDEINGANKRIPFSALIKNGLIKEGSLLYFGEYSDIQAVILANGQLKLGDHLGSLHKIGREIKKAPCNGWLAWYYINPDTGKREPVNELRRIARRMMTEGGQVTT